MRLWQEIESAGKRLQKAILRTPIIYSDTFSKLTGQQVFLKLENLQRGATRRCACDEPCLQMALFIVGLSQHGDSGNSNLYQKRKSHE